MAKKTRNHPAKEARKAKACHDMDRKALEVVFRDVVKPTKKK